MSELKISMGRGGTQHWTQARLVQRNITSGISQPRHLGGSVKQPEGNSLFVLETILTGAMRVIHITVKTEETQRLRIKFVLYCPTSVFNLKIKRANFFRKQNCQMFNAHSQGLTFSSHR